MKYCREANTTEETSVSRLQQGSEEQTAVGILMFCSACLHVLRLQSGSDSVQKADSQRLSLVFGTACSIAMSARRKHIHFEILITIITAVGTVAEMFAENFLREP